MFGYFSGSVGEVVVSSGSKEKESSSTSSSSSSGLSSSESLVDYHFSSACESKTLVRDPKSSLKSGYGFTIINDIGNLTITCTVDKTKYANVKSVNSRTTHTCYLQPLVSTNSLVLTATIDGTNTTSTINFCIASYHRGDLNCNGYIDMTDVVLLMDYYKYSNC